MDRYLVRLVDPLIGELLEALPAISLVGPRAAGKTTTALRFAQSILHLDRPQAARVARADPDAVLEELDEPILIDEWQEVPEVLGAVKRACDRDSRPGRFILTGSVRGEVDNQTWPGTGRVTRVEMFPLTVGEQTGSQESPWVDRVARGDPTLLRTAVSSAAPGPGAYPDGTDLGLRDYLRMALRGGFPQAALAASDNARRRWLDTYVSEIVGRDALAAGNGIDGSRLGRYFSAYALNCARIVDDAGLYAAAGIDRRTAQSYLNLLERIYVVHELAAWASSRTKRLAKRSKRFVVDSSLFASMAGITEPTAMQDGDLLGRLIETFVVSQLRAQAALSEHRCELYHLRQHNGRHEIDVIAELDGRKIAAIEVKATAAPTSRDARHLNWLRGEEPERFLAGIVLHTGPGSYPLGERLWALPISTLWQPQNADSAAHTAQQLR